MLLVIDFPLQTLKKLVCKSPVQRIALTLLKINSVDYFAVLLLYATPVIFIDEFLSPSMQRGDEVILDFEQMHEKQILTLCEFLQQMRNGVEFDIFADEMGSEAGLATGIVAGERVVRAGMVDAEMGDFVAGLAQNFGMDDLELLQHLLESGVGCFVFEDGGVVPELLDFALGET